MYVRMKDRLSGGFSDIGTYIEAGDRVIIFSDAFLQFQYQVGHVLLFGFIHGKIIFHVPLGDD